MDKKLLKQYQVFFIIVLAAALVAMALLPWPAQAGGSKKVSSVIDVDADAFWTLGFDTSGFIRSDS